MQKASEEYKSSMKQPYRNRGYISAKIGVYNHDAQNEIKFEETDSTATQWWSNNTKLFQSYKVSREYATKERGFCKLDGTRYFLPPRNSSSEIYNGGLILTYGSGEIQFSFKEEHTIKGLTINFGCNYPKNFKIETYGSNGTKVYTITNNDKEVFTTEEVFEDIDSFGILVTEMSKPDTVVRILELYCGIVNAFDNSQVLDYSWKEYVSSIAESVPSQDLSLTVDNQDMYYSPNNPDSALSFMELGQDISVSFGYELYDGSVEWIKPFNAYLKTWSADETKAKFTATDIFDYKLNSTYKNGKYYSSGISLYDLALDVFSDAGITDTRMYKIDNYLNDIKVYNPLPVCTHAEALQIIANAGRCAMLITRDGQICLTSSFVPTTSVSTNDMASWGSIDNILSSETNTFYAVKSKGFNKLNNTLLFYDSSNVIKNGYVSESYYKDGAWSGLTPTITISFESEWSFYGLNINFKHNHPDKFVITSYKNDGTYNSKTYTLNSSSELNWSTDEEFEDVNKIVISFTEGHEESRLYIDSIGISDITAYNITRTNDITGTSTAERNDKTKSISVSMYNYKQSTELKELASKEMTIDANADVNVTIDLSNPSYGYVVDSENTEIECSIESSSAYFCELRLSNRNNIPETFKYVLKGYEYAVDTIHYTKVHNNSGNEVTWNNPLISDTVLASKLEEWLSGYFLGQVSYTVPWRGDPRVDANDLFYIETANRGTDLIRVYQNELKFNGSWSGTMKGRVADLTWQ